MKDIIMFFIAVTTGLTLLFGGLAVMVNVYIEHQCNNYQQIAGRETKYASFDACYIKTDSGWQRWDEYKARAIASEGLKK